MLMRTFLLLCSAAGAACSENGSGDFAQPPPAPPPPQTAESSTCPCIDATAKFSGSRDIASAAVAAEMRDLGQDNCVTGSIIGPYVDSTGRINTEEFFCYAPDYGSNGCQAYDVDLSGSHGCATDSPPSWCASAWCYVDMEACRRSGIDMSGTRIFEDLKLYYSYGTCDMTMDEETEASLAFEHDANPITTQAQGEVLTVGIPTMDYPIHFKRDSTGALALGNEDPLYYDDSVPWEGTMIEFLDEILSVAPYAGFNYTFTSPMARLASPHSSWTATVYDVEKRLLDMGGSVFWVTAERTEMTAFSTSYHIDLHYLWVPRPKKDDSFLTVASKVFVPFSNNLWLLLFGVTIAMSFVEVYLFRKDWREDGVDDWELAVGWRAKARVYFEHWGTYLGRSAMHITAGFPDEGHTSAQTIAWIGWAFLIMIAVAAYTANLAAFMLAKGGGAYIKDMDNAISGQKKVCVQHAIWGDMSARYPMAYMVEFDASSLLGFDNPEDVWETCDAIVYSLASMQRQATLAQIFCDLDVAAVEVVLESGWAFTASHDLAPSLSLWIQTLTSAGIKYTDTFESPFYSNTCDEVPRLLNAMQNTDENTDHSRRSRSRRRRRRSRSRRRLKGGGGAGAAAAGSGDSVEESWTALNIGDDGELVRLPASTFTGVLLIWAFFVTLACVRSVYDQHEEEGLGDEALKKLKEKGRASTRKLKEKADKVDLLRQVMQTTLALQEKVGTQLSLPVPLPKLSHAPAGAPPKRVSPEEPKPVAAQVVQLNGAGEVQIGQVHAKIDNVEGQVGEMRGMLQALIDAQQKAPEHHTHQHHKHESSTATGTPSRLKKRRSQRSRLEIRPASAPERAPRSPTVYLANVF